jgi:hypothetical protein
MGAHRSHKGVSSVRALGKGGEAGDPVNNL